MKRTIVWPPRIRNGGAAMTADPANPATGADLGEALRQIIRLRILPGTNANPFVSRGQLGVTDRTFQRASIGDFAEHRAEVVQRFAELARARRARLVSLNYARDDGAVLIRVRYEDLELGRRLDLEEVVR